MVLRKGTWSRGPVENARLRVLSLGAGVQSTTLALMAKERIIDPIPDVAIFADTGEEPLPVMEHLEWLEKQADLPFEVVRVSAGSISEQAENGHRFASPPLFLSGGGMARRQCTREYKVAPITKEQRSLMGYKPYARIPPNSCEVWIGFSTDEFIRAGAAFDRWIANRFPLLEMGMSRTDCENWLQDHNYPIPMKSACVMCPFRSNEEWALLKRKDPEGFDRAISFDETIRSNTKLNRRAFVHHSREPLAGCKFEASQSVEGMATVCDGNCGT